MYIVYVHGGFMTTSVHNLYLTVINPAFLKINHFP